MKWVGRAPWSDAFALVLNKHVSPACAKAGIDRAELAEIIGADWTTTLWGCAFEDFLTRDIDGIGNVVEDYLKRRAWKETAHAKAYMAALRNSVMSLYEVSGVKPGHSFMARDLFRGGDPVEVSERTATRTLKQWDRIGARLVRVQGKTIMAGGVLLFSHECAEEAVAALRSCHAEAIESTKQIVAGESLEWPEAIFEETAALRAAAPLISTTWLADALEKALDRRRPQLHNSDGEALSFVTVRYRLSPGVAVRRVREAMDRIPKLDAHSARFWNWIAPQNDAPTRPARSSGVTFSTTSSDGYVVLGTVELKGKELVLSVNSDGRAERGRAMLGAALKDLVEEIVVERQTPDQLLANPPARRPRALKISPEEERQIVHETIDRHYLQQLDARIPTLGDATPRECTKSPEGRERLVRWLKQVENHMAKHEPDDPMAGYDTAWLWEALGVAELRK